MFSDQFHRVLEVPEVTRVAFDEKFGNVRTAFLSVKQVHMVLSRRFVELPDIYSAERLERDAEAVGERMRLLSIVK